MAYKKILFRRDPAASWTSENPVLSAGEVGLETDTGKIKIGNGSSVWTALSYFIGNLPGATLDAIGDVTITSVQNGDFLRYNGSASAWINDPVNLSTDTVGSYVESLIAGTGVSLLNNSGEGATPTISIGQAVGTSASVTFAQVETISNLVVGGNLTVNGTTTTLNTETLSIEDNFVVLNSNVTGSPTTNSGIEVERGTSANVAIRWNETLDVWEITTDGSGYSSIATIADVVSATDAITVESLSNTIITTPTHGQFLSYNSSSAVWVNDAIDLGTDTTGSYVQSLVAGTGVTLTNNSGESATPTVAIGQAVETSSSVTFAQVNAPLTGNVTGNVTGSSGSTTGNAATATALQNTRTISLSGDVSGSVSFDGSANVDISATIQTNSVALGTDTTGDYVSSLVAGTGVSLTNNSGESATPTIALDATLDNLSNVTVPSPTSGDFLKWDGDAWVNDPVNLGADTTGTYVADLVAGTGITITNGGSESASPTIAIGQSVATSASVIFAQVETTGDFIVGGDLSVHGTLTTINETNLAIEDTFIYLNDGSTTTNPDLGWAGNYNDGTYRHAGLFRDATDGKFKFFDSYTLEPTDPINVGHASYSAAPVVAEVFESTIATGTAPLSVSSSTAVTNLNADLLDGQHGSFYAPINNASFTGTFSAPSGTITSAMIADVSTNAQTASYTLVLSDKDKIVEMGVGSANNLTVPLNSSVAFPVGSQINILQTGSGQTTVVAAGGVTINATPGLKIRAQWSYATLIKRATDTWVLVGDVSA